MKKSAIINNGQDSFTKQNVCTKLVVRRRLTLTHFIAVTLIYSQIALLRAVSAKIKDKACIQKFFCAQPLCYAFTHFVHTYEHTMSVIKTYIFLVIF